MKLLAAIPRCSVLSDGAGIFILAYYEPINHSGVAI